MGGFEILKNIIDFNKAQKPADEEDIENNECPLCGWTLTENEKGEKSCQICGRIFK